MVKVLKSYLLVILSVVIFTEAITAQSERTNPGAQVMVLGVYHFNNPNLDAVKTSFPDHLSKKKQEEIREVLDRLAEFRPTRIVVEAVPEHEQVKKNYQRFLQDEYSLTANEIDQIGFRLAKRFGHETIYLADNKLDMNMGSVIAAAERSGNTAFLSAFQATINEIQAMQKRHESMSVRDVLAEMNEPAFQDKTRDLYLQVLRVKTDSSFEGADVLSAWYQRNFRILSNILQVVSSSEDRVLVIFGQSHAPYLRDAVKSYPNLKLVEPNDFLKRPGSENN